MKFLTCFRLLRASCSIQGLLFFGYGADNTTAMHYMQQAVISARRIKALNPGINITVVTNPGFRPPEVDAVFDMVRVQAAQNPNVEEL